MIEENQSSATTSLCNRCHKSIPAQIMYAENRVDLVKNCPEHGEQRVLLSRDPHWYAQTTAQSVAAVAPNDARPSRLGCPLDCGPCTQHGQRVHLPVVPITSACNLDCPICYTHNKNHGSWNLSDAELDGVLSHLRQAAPNSPIINLTGGEPTQHPDFLRIVERCVAEGFPRVTISTHGLRFLQQPWLLEALAKLDARIVLSFDSFEEEINRRMLGGTFARGKLAVLELLKKFQVNTTLLPVIAKGVNDHELGRLVELALGEEHIRHLELHPMTFTGQSGVSFDRAARITPDEILDGIEQQTKQLVRKSDFTSSPIAHPLCYQVCYLLRDNFGNWIPLARLGTTETLRKLLGERLYLEATPQTELAMLDLLNEAWIEHGDDSAAVHALRAFVDDVFAEGVDSHQATLRAERRTKAIYLHWPMDEETFDSERIRLCPISIREADGRNIPACTYNILYRARDPRFGRPHPELDTLGPGRFWEI